MRNRTIILSALVLTAACKPASEATTVPAAKSVAAVAPRWTPPLPPPEVFPVPPGTPCDFRGWSSDTDPAGLNVRTKPSATAPIAGKLPPPKYDPDYERAFAVSFSVTESRDGWFHITNAYRFDDDMSKPSTLPSGWVVGRHIRFALQTEVAFEQPDPRSRVVVVQKEATGYQWLDYYRQPSECRGRWVKLLVAGRKGGPEHPAWVRGVCGNEETSCDGQKGDDATTGPVG